MNTLLWIIGTLVAALFAFWLVCRIALMFVDVARGLGAGIKRLVR